MYYYIKLKRRYTGTVLSSVTSVLETESTHRETPFSIPACRVDGAHPTCG